MKKFYVLHYNVNKNEFEPYDVLPYFRNCLNKATPFPENFENFKKFIIDVSRYMFWARCEYELILSDWPTQKTEEKIDMHYQIMMNIDTVCEILFEEYAKRFEKP